MALDKKFEHLKIELEAIKKATNNFADEYCIGKGGFGHVYKGELINSGWPTLVAIKQLDRKFGQGDPEFWKEIIMLSRYRHENLVSLLGFCDDSGEKILVYEYASRRSLDRYLNSSEVTWIRRLNICIGAARGLAYLHDPGESQQRVLHRDIKSSNILLDENWNARISDFGLSKFGPANQKDTFVVSHAVGTHGYVDPLYLESGFLTKESDVYSFGVMLFEVLCGRLCTDKNGKYLTFTRLIRYHYKNNKMDEIVYSNIKQNMSPDSLKAFAKIAYLCLEIDQYEQRPLMTRVVSELKSALQNQASYNDSISNLLQENRTNRSTGELLNVEPHELLFSFALMKRVTCVIQLTNKTDSHVAFKVKHSFLEKYIVDRNIGIVLPYDTCDVIATIEARMMAPPNMECKDTFLIQCAVVNGGTRTKDITQELFNKESWNQVEECELKVKYIYTPLEQPLLPEAEVLEEASSSMASISDNVTVSDDDSISELVQKNNNEMSTAELLIVEPQELLLFPLRTFKQTISNTIVLTGLSGGGKTVLFYQLRDGSSHPDTVTSMEPNEGLFVLNSETSKKGKIKAVHVVDVPGQSHLRPKLDDYLPRAAGIVFVVDAVEFLPNCRAASEYLYDILTKASVVKRKIPLLILCNKVDKVTAHTKGFIRKQLEKEIDKLRTSRTAISDADIANEFTLGVPGEAFSFSQCINKVTVGEASALTGEILPSEQFIRECVKP